MPISYVVRKKLHCMRTWEDTNARENDEYVGIHNYVKLVDLPESGDYF